MSTLQEFLIKSAGMEKAALTAIAKRLLASTMSPQEVIKRFGKVKGNRYLDEATAAIKNNFNRPAVSGKATNSTKDYLRGLITSNAARHLYFNNRLSKSDYLKYLESRPYVSNGGLAYAGQLRSAGVRSGLSGLYKTLPRQDRLIVSKYLRGRVPESGLQHLSTDVQRVAQDARARLLNPNLGPGRSYYAKTLSQEYGIQSREELIKAMQDQGIDFDPNKLQHSHYVTGMSGDLLNGAVPAHKHRLLAATKLPYTTPDRLPAQRAALKDVLRTSGQFNSKYLGANTSNLPRSVQKALQIIRGENLLEPGTRANRLFNKVYNHKTFRDVLNSSKSIQTAAAGRNAFYMPKLDAIAVPPKMLGSKNTAGVVAHERGHRAAYTMAPDAHADEAFNLFRRMQLLGNKHNMKVPLNDSKLMQEVFAESYIPKLLGPNSGAAWFVSPKRQLRAVEARGFAGARSKKFRRNALNQIKANRDAIDAMNASEDMKDLFRQLAFNYGHSFV